MSIWHSLSHSSRRARRIYWGLLRVFRGPPFELLKTGQNGHSASAKFAGLQDTPRVPGGRRLPEPDSHLSTQPGQSLRLSGDVAEAQSGSRQEPDPLVALASPRGAGTCGHQLILESVSRWPILRHRRAPGRLGGIFMIFDLPRPYRGHTVKCASISSGTTMRAHGYGELFVTLAHLPPD